MIHNCFDIGIDVFVFVVFVVVVLFFDCACVALFEFGNEKGSSNFDVVHHSTHDHATIITRWRGRAGVTDRKPVKVSVKGVSCHITTTHNNCSSSAAGGALAES